MIFASNIVIKLKFLRLSNPIKYMTEFNLCTQYKFCDYNLKGEHKRYVLYMLIHCR